jgi:hypothetical protein
MPLDWLLYSGRATMREYACMSLVFALGSFVSWRALIAFSGERVSTVRLLRNLMRLNQGHEAG